MLLIPGLALVAYGALKHLGALRFNRDDSARADRVHAALDQLCRAEPSAAYEQDNGLSRAPRARLVRVTQHFDSTIAGDVIGSLQHQLGFFGQSFAVAGGPGYVTAGPISTWGRLTGQSNVTMKISANTRDNLTGDALMAVVEIPTADGGFDTLRVLGVSQPAVRSWIVDLTARAAAELGGSTTHAGQAVAAWGTRLANAFGGTEVSYAADQLLAIAERDAEDTPALGVAGIPVGRNAVLATTMSIADRRVVSLLPHRLPHMLAAALSSAVGQVVAPRTPPALAS